MTNERLQEVRTTARKEADSELSRQGFVHVEGKWAGRLTVESHGVVCVQVQLPDSFPDALPEVFVDRSKLARRVPHIEKNGKLCLAPNNTVLLDASQPRGIIDEALGRARKLLAEGLSGNNERDLQHEFLAYWTDGVTAVVASICDPQGGTRVVSKLMLSGSAKERLGTCLIADNVESGKAWLSRLGHKHDSVDEAFLVPLRAPFTPPDFDEQVLVRQLRDLIMRESPDGTYDALRAWLAKAHLPVTVLLSMPLAGDRGRVLVGAQLDPAVGEDKRLAQAGFREGMVPAKKEINFTMKRPVSKLAVTRLDSEYLIARGGGGMELREKSVAIIGCGAVGSYTCDAVASLGVGRIRLVDHDTLSEANVHRHRLGVDALKLPKVDALAASLRMRLPHVTVDWRRKKVEEVLEGEPDYILTADLVLVCIGDETTELRLNSLLGARVPRLHAWLEPLGLAGHVLVTALPKGIGCYRCLFGDEIGYGSKASLAAPGQQFQKSYAGCAGVYTPFAALDAEQVAVNAATCVSGILLGREKSNVLLTWMRDPSVFCEQGFLLSDRGKSFKPHEIRREEGFGRRDCDECGQWRS